VAGQDLLSGKLIGDNMDSHGKVGKQAPVTAVIPCYRCADTIDRAVMSAIRQTMPPKEIILIDDGSPDAGKTAVALKAIQDRCAGVVDCRIITLSHNQGPAAARNAGWNAASQPFIAFLDADDAWHPKKLEIQYPWMDAHPRAVLSGHPSVRSRGNTEWEKLPDQGKFWKVTEWRLLLRNRFPTRSVMLCRDIDFRFDPSKRYGEDYLLWLQILMAGFEAWRVELPLACSYKPDFSAGGLSAELWRMEQSELETYRRLYQQKLIPFLALGALMTWSLLRYCRRVLAQPLWNNGLLK
jgi:glycosyltransferase involved in cell wall biosynthesis